MRPGPLQFRDKVLGRIRALVELAETGNTSKRLWQIVFGRDDTDQAEVFGPLGYAARPAARGARTLVLRAGDGTVSFIVAFQDPKARALELAEDERALFNDNSQVVLRSDGAIEIGNKHNHAVLHGNGTIEIGNGHSQAVLGNNGAIELNGSAQITVTTGGTVEIKGGGLAKALATKADTESLDARIGALEGAFNAHTHAYAPGPGNPIPTAGPLPVSATGSVLNGTSVLRAE